MIYSSWTSQWAPCAGRGPPPAGARLQAQLSAHGRPLEARWEGDPTSAGTAGRVVLREPARRVAPGQAVVLYEPDPAGDIVLGGGTAL